MMKGNRGKVKTKIEWTKTAICWQEKKTLFFSIPFTWDLPKVKARISQRDFFWDKVIVGGPAVQLLPNFFSDIDYASIGQNYPGVLQRINPQATRTTIGCIRKCEFCGVPKFEGSFQELAEWPNLPVICDNNLLASSQNHFDRVMDRLEIHGWADFNQGLDCRLLNQHHAERFARIRPMIRLALDNMRNAKQWSSAFDTLRIAGIAKANIRSYALIGFDSDPSEAWNRCEWIEKHGVKALPMWFHGLHQLEKNIITPKQKRLGWNDYERRRIMQWFYQHKMAVRNDARQ